MSDDKLTVHDIRKVSDELFDKAVSSSADGYYWISMDGKSYRDIQDMQARQSWKEYYRSVRILRRIRRGNPDQFKRFSSVWWRSQYKHECVTNLFHSQINTKRGYP